MRDYVCALKGFTNENEEMKCRNDFIEKEKFLASTENTSKNVHNLPELKYSSESSDNRKHS